MKQTKQVHGKKLFSQLILCTTATSLVAVNLKTICITATSLVAVNLKTTSK